MTAKKLFYSSSAFALALTALTSSPSFAMDDQDKSHLTVQSSSSSSSSSLTSLDEQTNPVTTTTPSTITSSSSSSSLTSLTTTQEEPQNTTTIMSHRGRKRWANHVGFQNLKEATSLIDEPLFLTISYLQEPTADEYFHTESNPWFLPYPITINVEGGPLDIPTRCLILNLTFPEIEDSQVNLWACWESG